MNVRTVCLVTIAICSSGWGVACAAAPAPSPTPLPRPSPTASVVPPTELLPTPVSSRMAPADVPACQDAKNLDQPIQFVWAGINDIIRDAPATNWTYYRCAQSPAMLSAAYRQWMRQSPYNWLETYWEEQPGVTLGAYFHKDPDRWLYLWFLSETSEPQASNLVAAWWNVRPSC